MRYDDINRKQESSSPESSKEQSLREMIQGYRKEQFDQGQTPPPNLPLPAKQGYQTGHLKPTDQGQLPAILPEPAREYSIRDLIQGYWEFVTVRQEYTTTGVTSLNEALGGGLEPKRLVALLGSSGSGKTAFANQVATHVANIGRPVFYVINEDTPLNLFAKTIARVGNVPYTTVLQGREYERTRIRSALNDYVGTRSVDLLRYLDGKNGVSLETIRDKAQLHFARYNRANKGGPGLLVIDSLQRLARAQRNFSDSGQEDLSTTIITTTEKLQALAREMGCCIMVLVSQKNMSTVQTHREYLPLALDTEIGDLEYLADVIIGIGEDRDTKHKNALTKPWMLWMAKNRQGENNKKIPLDWRPDRQMFIDSRKEE